MRKFGAFLARKPAEAALAPTPGGTTLPETKLPDNPLELDEELFSAIGAQMGGENETLRNLLLDANAKIGELDTIKDAVGRLVDPVSKTLRAIESERSEKLALQTVLNNTRTDIAARRAQIADLEAQLAQATGENKAFREENQRLDERLDAANKRIITLESELNKSRQKLLMAEDEKRAQQGLLDKAGAEAARLSRKLAETEASLNATQGRLRHLEANVAEISMERTRLAGALDEANERNEHERANQRARFDALQARAAASEKLLGEAREHLIARAEEIRDFDRRMSATARERDGLQTKVAELDADRITRESELKELAQTKATLIDRTAALARAYNAKEAALERAEQTVVALNQRIESMDLLHTADRLTAEQTVEELTTAVKREQLERSVSDGALETARKDFARVAREVMALQRNQASLEAHAQPRAANAA